jgi:hypothetical protein
MSDLLDATVNLTGNQTIAGVKTFGSTIVGSIDSIKETGAGAGTIRKKIIEIGDWNMDAASDVVKAHGLDISKIRIVSVLIHNDDNNSLYPINYHTLSGEINGYWVVETTNIKLFRLTGGIFDGPGYNATSYNRGWIVIEYVD